MVLNSKTEFMPTGKITAEIETHRGNAGLIGSLTAVLVLLVLTCAVATSTTIRTMLLVWLVIIVASAQFIFRHFQARRPLVTAGRHPYTRVPREGKKSDWSVQESKIGLDPKKMIKVDGEVVVISCERCGSGYGILVEDFCSEILPACSCGKCHYPLFSSEELRAKRATQN
jgi:hypothetical protein